MKHVVLNGKYQPNIFMDFYSGTLKCNKIQESILPARYAITTGDSAYFYNYEDVSFEETTANIPANNSILDFSKGNNFKLDNIFYTAQDIYNQSPDEFPLGAKTVCRKVGYTNIEFQYYSENAIIGKNFLIMMPNTAPITTTAGVDGGISIVDIPEGTKCTIESPVNFKFMQDISRNLNVPDEEIDNFVNVSSEDNLIKPLRYYIKDCYLLCADPRVFNFASYSLFDGESLVTSNNPTISEDTKLNIYFAPETEIHDEQNKEFPTSKALKGYFRVNDKLTKFLLITPGSIVKMIARKDLSPIYKYDEEKGDYIVDAYETITVWDVDNNSDFEEVNITVKYEPVEGHSFRTPSLTLRNLRYVNTENPSSSLGDSLIEELNELGVNDMNTSVFGTGFYGYNKLSETPFFASKSLKIISDKYNKFLQKIDSYNEEVENVNIEVTGKAIYNDLEKDIKYVMNNIIRIEVNYFSRGTQSLEPYETITL